MVGDSFGSMLWQNSRLAFALKLAHVCCIYPEITSNSCPVGHLSTSKCKLKPLESCTFRFLQDLAPLGNKICTSYILTLLILISYWLCLCSQEVENSSVSTLLTNPNKNKCKWNNKNSIIFNLSFEHYFNFITVYNCHFVQKL